MTPSALGNVIPFPIFDDHSELIATWIIAIRSGRLKDTLKSMSEVHATVSRVRKSLRHAKLAEFLHHSIDALSGGETEGARYILLTALAQFGWNVDIDEAR